MTDEDLEKAKIRQKIKEIERKDRLAEWNDYVSFFTSKTLGLGGLSIGGLEFLTPEVLDITLSNPEVFAGAGIALLAGKSILKLVVAGADAIGKKL